MRVEAGELVQRDGQDDADEARHDRANIRAEENIPRFRNAVHEMESGLGLRIHREVGRVELKVEQAQHDEAR